MTHKWMCHGVMFRFDRLSTWNIHCWISTIICTTQQSTLEELILARDANRSLFQNNLFAISTCMLYPKHNHPNFGRQQAYWLNILQGNVSRILRLSQSLVSKDDWSILCYSLWCTRMTGLFSVTVSGVQWWLICSLSQSLVHNGDWSVLCHSLWCTRMTDLFSVTASGAQWWLICSLSQSLVHKDDWPVLCHSLWCTMMTDMFSVTVSGV